MLPCTGLDIFETRPHVPRWLLVLPALSYDPVIMWPYGASNLCQQESQEWVYIYKPYWGFYPQCQVLRITKLEPRKYTLSAYSPLTSDITRCHEQNLGQKAMNDGTGGLYVLLEG